MLSSRRAQSSEHILKMTTPRLGLVIVFSPAVALCSTSCDWVTEQQGVKLPVSPVFFFCIFFSSPLCSSITAAGQTFVLRTQGGRPCINARSEPRKTEMRGCKEKNVRRSLLTAQQRANVTIQRHVITHLLTVGTFTRGCVLSFSCISYRFKLTTDKRWGWTRDVCGHTSADYTEGPCGSRRRPLASSAWKAASATHIS